MAIKVLKRYKPLGSLEYKVKKLTVKRQEVIINTNLRYIKRFILHVKSQN